MTRLLIGGYTGDKGAGSGITVLEDDGRSSATIPADSPSWIARHPELAGAVRGRRDRRRARCTPGRSRTACRASRSASGATGGAEPAHLTVDPTGTYLITVNYSGGSISVHRLGPDGSIGAAHRPGPARGARRTPAPGAGAPAHGAARPTTACWSSTSAVTRSTSTGSRPTGSSSPTASSPRRPARARGTCCPAGEPLLRHRRAERAGARLRRRLAAGRRGAGQRRPIGPNQPSELVERRPLPVRRQPRPEHGDRSSRSTAALPRYVTEVPAGDWPRHIALDGERLYVANERSHEVMVMTIDPDDRSARPLVRTIEVPSPTVVLP